MARLQGEHPASSCAIGVPAWVARGVARRAMFSIGRSPPACRRPPAFTGFFSPVKAVPAFTPAKAGQTIPLKFSLDGDRGLDIFASGPTVTPVSCQDLAPTGPAVAATGKLHYDPTAGQYIYTWQTDKSWAGSCAKLSFLLVDGSTHEALFHFTK